MAVMSAFNLPRPPQLRFFMQPVEDRQASDAAGHKVMKDVPSVAVAQLGSKDWSEFTWDQWISQMEIDSRHRPHDMLPQWVEDFRNRYNKWRAGEELTVNGTAIKSVSFLMPSEVQNLTNIGVHSVEDAAAMNDECMRRFGFGGLKVKDKCANFLANRDAEKASYEVGRLKEKCEQQEAELAELKAARTSLENRLAGLEQMLEQQTAPSKGKR
jgi:hypothetical protein